MLQMVIVSGISMIMFAVVFARASSGNVRAIIGKDKDTKTAAGNMYKEQGTMLVAKYLVWYPVGEQRSLAMWRSC